MDSIDDALKKIRAHLKPGTETESLPLLKAWHRVLAEAEQARTDVPPADLSAMDGYALRCSDLQAGEWMPVSQRIPAGRTAEPLQAGSAARLFTGSVIPSGADTVVIQENCEAREGAVKILKQPQAGDNIRRAGQDMKRGATLLTPGHFLRPQDIGMLAAGGVDRLTVFRRLRVALLSSGDELAEPGQPLRPGQIYNANRFNLDGLVRGLNMEPRHYPPVADTLAATEAALQQAAAECDVVITTGGVSVGEEDHIKQALAKLGELQLWKLRIKPGKPLAFGHLGSTAFFGLPGNPVAAFVTFILVVRPCLLMLQGHARTEVETLRYPAAFSQSQSNSRQEYLRVRIENGCLQKYPSQDSGILSSTSWANALAIVPADTTVAAGDSLEVIPFSHLAFF